VVNSNDPDAALDQSGTSCLSATSISVDPASHLDMLLGHAAAL
jgi:hypothetical protein